jgi:hypothetical protein
MSGKQNVKAYVNTPARHPESHLCAKEVCACCARFEIWLSLVNLSVAADSSSYTTTHRAEPEPEFSFMSLKVENMTRRKYMTFSPEMSWLTPYSRRATPGEWARCPDEDIDALKVGLTVPDL